jgi:hypothetical protein
VNGVFKKKEKMARIRKGLAWLNAGFDTTTAVNTAGDVTELVTAISGMNEHFTALAGMPEPPPSAHTTTMPIVAAPAVPIGTIAVALASCSADCKIGLITVSARLYDPLALVPVPAFFWSNRQEHCLFIKQEGATVQTVQERAYLD